MKIPKIFNNSYVKQTALFMGFVVPVLYLQYKCNKGIVEDIKSEIKAKDFSRFKRVEEQNKQRDYMAQKGYWIQEREAMNDSLKLDSVSKKAYFEGMQAVRDSLANAKE